MDNELDFLRRYSDTQAPVENLSSDQKKLEALKKASELAKLNEFDNDNSSLEDRLVTKYGFNPELNAATEPTSNIISGKMPSQTDLSPFSSKIDLSKYVMSQPEMVGNGESDQKDPTAKNREAIFNSLIPSSSPLGKSIAENKLKEQADREAAVRQREYSFNNSPAVNPEMLEPFSTNKIDLSRYFGNAEGASNLVDMNAKLPPSKSTPSWSADAVKQSQEMKSTEGTQPKLSAAQNKAIQSNPTKAKEEAEAKVKEAEKTLSAQDISTKEYDDAIKQRNMNQFIATMAQAAERIGYSLAGGNAQVLKPDLSFTNKMMEQAGQPVVDLKERRKEKEEQEGNDPNSAKSKQFQDILISMHPELESKIRKMSYTNLEKQFPSIMNALNAREGIRARKETAAFNREALDIAKNKATLETQNSAITNDLVKLDKKHTDELGELNNAIKVAELGELNPVAATNVVRAIVKGVEGGNGKVSDKDITTAMGYRGVSGELQAWIRGKTTGTMPKTLTKDIINLMYAMKDVKQKSYENSMNNILEIRARGQRRDVNEVKEQFIPGYSANKTQELNKKPEATSNKDSWEYKGK
jgi:hypothetical protein